MLLVCTYDRREDLNVLKKNMQDISHMLCCMLYLKTIFMLTTSLMAWFMDVC